MRSLPAIEKQIAEIKRRIIEKQRLNNISKFAGAEELALLFNETMEFYEQAIRALDENSPVLGKEYAKNKACLSLINGFVAGLKSAEEALVALKKTFLDLNEELQKAQDELKRREKESF